MLTSDDRMLTTHTGSLPRSEELAELMVAREGGKLDADQAARLPGLTHEATTSVLQGQADAGIDVASDGEQGKIGYATYVKERISGFGGEAGALSLADLDDYPEIADQALQGLVTVTPSCDGPVAYIGQAELQQELSELRESVDSVHAGGNGPAEVFVPAASPGVIATYLPNEHYDSQESYLGALAEAMRTEYETIAEAGFIVQIDCPDLAMGRHVQYAQHSIGEFRDAISSHVEALNYAVSGIDPDRLRMHLCWGNRHRAASPASRPRVGGGQLPSRPRVEGVRADAAAGGQGADPRRDRHVQQLRRTPGPGRGADRALCLAGRRGAGHRRPPDCGFSSFASFRPVLPQIVWAKLATLAEGARRASQRIYSPAVAV